MENAIVVKDLVKIYNQNKVNEKKALKGINLSIPRGCVYGLLGPNGAGKSTFINILAGQVNKTSGSVNCWGFDLDEDPIELRRSIGFVLQEINFDPFFTPRETLELQAGLYGVPKSQRKTEELLSNLSLLDKADSNVRGLSGGMKRRMMIAKAMVYSPPILILDEPTAGVDIELRTNLWENIRQLNKIGVTIILTTHYLEEAQEMCDYITIINSGEIVASDNTKDLLKIIDKKTLKIKFSSPLSTDIKIDNVQVSRIDDHNLHLSYSSKNIDVGTILEKINFKNNNIIDISVEEADLEDIFLMFTK